jgi:hypothetical protein
MGNFCSFCSRLGDSEKKVRESVDRQLFDLYDRTGEFTLTNDELHNLSLFLYNKQDLQYQAQIEKKTAEYNQFKEMGPKVFVKKSIGETGNITYDNFIMLTHDINIKEMKELLHEAKQNEISLLQQELILESDASI